MPRQPIDNYNIKERLIVGAIIAIIALIIGLFKR